MSSTSNRPDPEAMTNAARPIASIAPPGDDASELSAEERALVELLEEYGSSPGLKLLVERYDAEARGNDGYAYLGTVPLAEDWLEEVAERFGGGQYRGRVYQGKRYLRRVQFAIGGEPVSAIDRAARIGPKSAPASAELEELRAHMRELASTVRDLAAAVARPAAPAGDPLDMVVKVAGVLRDLTPATPAAAGAAANPSELLNIVDKVFELRDRVLETAPPERGGSDIVEVARELGTPLVRMLERKQEQEEGGRMTNAGARAAGAAEKRAAGPSPAGSNPPAHSGALVDPIVSLLRTVPGFALSYLAGMAARGKDATLYADTVLDAIDSAGRVDDLTRELVRPEFLAVMLRAVPAWAPHRDWFRELVSALRSALGVDDPELERPAPARQPVQLAELPEHDAARDLEDLEARAERLEAERAARPAAKSASAAGSRRPAAKSSGKRSSKPAPAKGSSKSSSKRGGRRR